MCSSLRPFSPSARPRLEIAQVSALTKAELASLHRRWLLADLDRPLPQQPEQPAPVLQRRRLDDLQVRVAARLKRLVPR